MTLDLAREAAQALVEALSPDPPTSTPPARSESTPSTSTATIPEPLIERLLTAMEARETRWMEAMERQARETREALITMAHGPSPTFYGPSPAEIPIPSDLQPGPATGPGQQGLSMSSYDDDSIPLAPGIESVLAREASEDEADRQRILRTAPDVLEFQLEQRRQAAGMGPMGPAPPPGSPL